MTAMRVRDVMTQAQWILPADCPLTEGARRMRQWGVRWAFVVDAGRLLGVVTDTDLIVVALASGRPPSKVKIGDCHNPNAPRVDADQPLSKAYPDAHHTVAGWVAVVKGEFLLGIVRSTDLYSGHQLNEREPHTRQHLIDWLQGRHHR